MKFIRVLKSDKNYQQLTFDDINKINYSVTVSKKVIDSDLILKEIYDYQDYNFNTIDDLMNNRYIKTIKLEPNSKEIFCESKDLVQTIIDEFKLVFNPDIFYSVNFIQLDENYKTIKSGNFCLYQGQKYTKLNSREFINSIKNKMIKYQKGYKKQLGIK